MGLRPSWAPLTGFRAGQCLSGCPPIPARPPISWLGMRPLCVVLVLGAVLLDLDQQTLPGVAHQVVEQMVISDQIKAEDRANVLRALLLKHR